MGAFCWPQFRTLSVSSWCERTERRSCSPPWSSRTAPTVLNANGANQKIF